MLSISVIKCWLNMITKNVTYSGVYSRCLYCNRFGPWCGLWEAAAVHRHATGRGQAECGGRTAVRGLGARPAGPWTVPAWGHWGAVPRPHWLQTETVHAVAQAPLQPATITKNVKECLNWNFPLYWLINL